jgi:hypothetical protein
VAILTADAAGMQMGEAAANASATTRRAVDKAGAY